jgi:hypothetical protein
MSALVHPENQKIIWNIVNSNIYVNDFFQTHTHVSKEQWFRSIIEKFYLQNEGRNLSMEELNLLNKDVLTFMVKSIHSIPVQSPPQEPRQQVPDPYAPSSQTNYSPQIQTPPYVPNNIGEQTNQQFEDKRQEYAQMYAKPVPEEVDFKEKEKDTIIENMDELINKHISEREQQMKELTPNIIMNVKPVVSMPTDDLSNNITVEIQEKPIENAEVDNDETPLKIQIIELKEKIQTMQTEYDALKKEISDKVEGSISAISRIEEDILSIRENANKIKQLDQQSENSVE